MALKLILIQYVFVMNINEIHCQSLSISDTNVDPSSIMDTSSVFNQLRTTMESETTEMYSGAISTTTALSITRIDSSIVDKTLPSIDSTGRILDTTSGLGQLQTTITTQTTATHSDVTSTTIKTTELYDSSSFYTLDNSYTLSKGPSLSTTYFVRRSSFTAFTTSTSPVDWSSVSASYVNTPLPTSTDILKVSTISNSILSTSYAFVDTVSPSSVMSAILPTLSADSILSTMSGFKTLSSSPADNTPTMPSSAVILPTPSVLLSEEVLSKTSINISPVMTNVDTLSQTLLSIVSSVLLSSSAENILSTSVSELSPTSVVDSKSSSALVVDTSTLLTSSSRIMSVVDEPSMSSITHIMTTSFVVNMFSSNAVSDRFSSSDMILSSITVLRSVAGVSSNLDSGSQAMSSRILSIDFMSSSVTSIHSDIFDATQTSPSVLMSSSIIATTQTSSSALRSPSLIATMQTSSSALRSSSIIATIQTSSSDLMSTSIIATMQTSSSAVMSSTVIATTQKSSGLMSSSIIATTQTLSSALRLSSTIETTQTSSAISSTFTSSSVIETSQLSTTQTSSVFMSSGIIAATQSQTSSVFVTSSIIAGNNSTSFPWGSTASKHLPNLQITLSFVLFIMYFIT